MHIPIVFYRKHLTNSLYYIAVCASCVKQLFGLHFSSGSLYKDDVLWDLALGRVCPSNVLQTQ